MGRNKKEIKEEVFQIKESNYNALVEGYLDLKKNLLHLHKEFEKFRLEIRFEHGADQYKGKYWIYYDEPTNKTYIQEEGDDNVYGYLGILTSPQVLKEYLDE